MCPWFVVALLLNSIAPPHRPSCAELIRWSYGNSLSHMTVGCANNGLQRGQMNVPFQHYFPPLKLYCFRGRKWAPVSLSVEMQFCVVTRSSPESVFSQQGRQISKEIVLVAACKTHICDLLLKMFVLKNWEGTEMVFLPRSKRLKNESDQVLYL